MSSETLKNKKLVKVVNSLKDIYLEEIDLDKKIIKWIEIIGKYSNSDRGYVYFFSKDKNGFIITNNTHEFCKKGIHSVKQDQQNIPIDLFPFYKNVVYDKLEVACINSINELTDEAKPMKELMEFQGVKSILAIPISREDNPIGFIGFETVKKEKKWTEEHLELLKQVAELILMNQ